jgi:hypothetical protein
MQKQTSLRASTSREFVHFQIEIGETSSSLRTFYQNQTQEMSKIRIKYIESCSIVLEHPGNTQGTPRERSGNTLGKGEGRGYPLIMFPFRFRVSSVLHFVFSNVRMYIAQRTGYQKLVGNYSSKSPKITVISANFTGIFYFLFFPLRCFSFLTKFFYGYTARYYIV